MRSRPQLTPLDGRDTPATFTVTTLSDVTAADGQTTLREAVALANAAPGPDAIAFDPALAGGTIALGTAGLSLAEDVTVTGFPDNPVTVAGAFPAGAAPTDVFVVPAGATAAISGLRVTNTTPLGHGVTNLGTLTLDRVTIRGVAGGSGFRNAGTATVANSVITGNTAAATFEGGGVTNLGGTLAIRDSRLEGNASTNALAGSGGGLLQLAGRVDLTNVTVAGNKAAVGGGGVAVLSGTLTAAGGRAAGNVAPVGGGFGLLGLQPLDATSTVTTVTLTGVAIDGNTAASGGGVGVATGDAGFPAAVTLANCTVSNNAVDPDSTANLVFGVTADTPPRTIALPRGIGGGVAVAGGTVTVTGGTVAGNTGTTGGGVGVLLGSVILAGAEVTANTAVSGAGAAFLQTSAGATTGAVTAVTFANNAAAAGQIGTLAYAVPGISTPAVARGAGGGVYVNGAAVTLTNATTAANAATTGGGAAVEGGTLGVFNSTLAGNAAGAAGGGLWLPGGATTVRSSVVAGNTAAAGPDAAGPVTSAGGNVVGVADGSTGFGAGDRAGTAALPLDPRLGPLANNGGPVRTRLPATNSPAVDAGAAAGAPTTDARGLARVAGAAVDAGAVERQPSDPTAGARAAAARTFAVGSDAGMAGTVAVYNPDGSPRTTLTPFGPTFTGGIRTATADLTGDGIEDVVVATGPGVPTRVQVVNGLTGAVAFDVPPFEATFTGGVYVAVGDLTGDGVADLVVTPDEGGGPRADVYAGGAFGKVASFFGIDDVNFRGGARASVGDLNADGTADLVVVAGFGGGPRVAGFDGPSVAAGAPVKLFADFFAFEQTLRNGVFVTAGDLNGDGYADLIAGGGPGGGPRILAFDGKALLANTYTPLANFFGGDPASRGGIRVATKDLDGDTLADLVVGAGARVTAYDGKAVAPAGTPPAALDFDAIAGAAGVFVG